MADEVLESNNQINPKPEVSKTATIAVGNSITGIFNYISIGLPDMWRIATQSMNSDVYSTAKQGNVKWVADGEVEHYIQTKNGMATLRLNIKRGLKDKTKFRSIKKAGEYKKVKVQTHTAEVFKYVEKVLWKKRPAMGVLFQCSETDRTILIECIEGEPWIEEILDHLKDSICHLSKNYEKALTAYSSKDFE